MIGGVGQGVGVTPVRTCVCLPVEEQAVLAQQRHPCLGLQLVPERQRACLHAAEVRVAVHLAVHAAAARAATALMARAALLQNQAWIGRGGACVCVCACVRVCVCVWVGQQHINNNNSNTIPPGINSIKYNIILFYSSIIFSIIVPYMTNRSILAHREET